MCYKVMLRKFTAVHKHIFIHLSFESYPFLLNKAWESSYCGKKRISRYLGSTSIQVYYEFSVLARLYNFPTVLACAPCRARPHLFFSPFLSVRETPPPSPHTHAHTRVVWEKLGRDLAIVGGFLFFRGE